MKILVGNTGFVGSNLQLSCSFDYVFNSGTIHYAYNLNPDLCIYAGVYSRKYYANKKPDVDYLHIEQAKNNILKINPKKLILISTIDVLDNRSGSDEDYEVNVDNLDSYGRNRFLLEEWVKDNIIDYHIVRLPAIYGHNLKKNFIFDMMNPIPSVLTKQTFRKLNKSSPFIDYYYEEGDFFYNLKNLNRIEKKDLLNALMMKNFAAVNFTDSRSVFQFYPLGRLSYDLEIIIREEIRLIHLTTEPINASELYVHIFGDKFSNIRFSRFSTYNVQTKYSYLWTSSRHYLIDKEWLLEDIRLFVNKNLKDCF